MAVYVDSSALVKLLVEESESAALRKFLRNNPHRISSGLARTELRRAVGRERIGVHRKVSRLLRNLHLVALDSDVLDAAGVLEPKLLRSLDAIHLAAARTVRPFLDSFVTYDRRMRSAAESLGFTVHAPS